jgi:hypothetical protein
MANVAVPLLAVVALLSGSAAVFSPLTYVLS